MGPSSKVRNTRFRIPIFLALLLVLSACRHTERSLSGAYKPHIHEWRRGARLET